MIKRKFSVLLALAAVSAIFCLLPGTALAEGETHPEGKTCYVLNDQNERVYYDTLQQATFTAQHAIESGNDRKQITVYMCADEVVQRAVDSDIGMYIYENVTIEGNNCTLSVPVTGTNEMGVINDNPSAFHLIYNKKSDYHEPCTLTINNLKIYGGGMSAILNKSNLEMNNCTITRSGVKDVEGGGIYNLNAENPTVTAYAYLNNCTLSRNVARYGAGFMNGAGSVMVLENCAISENYAADGYAGGGGGENKGTLYMNNCTVANNQTFELGGGLNNKGIAYILNCAFIGNVATPVDSSRQLGANCGGGITLLHDKNLAVNGTLYVVNTIFSENSVRAENITSGSAPRFLNELIFCKFCEQIMNGN